MKWLCIVVFLFIFFTKHALAEKIVVSATRLSQGLQNSGSRVEVWEADELSKTQSFDAKKVFSNAVGLQTNSSGGPGQSATVFIRGANSEHTLFLLDGIELNEPLTPTRNFDFSQFALQGVEKVEILRGPQSVLYGSDALGGVILMQQKSGYGPWQSIFRANYGSNYTMQIGNEITRGNESWSFFQDLDWFQTKGISAADAKLAGNSERDGSKKFTHNLRVEYKGWERNKIRINSRYTQGKIASDNFGGAFGDNAYFTTDLKQYFSRIQWDHLARNPNILWQSGYNFSLHDRRTATPQTSNFLSHVHKADLIRNQIFENSQLSLGMDAKNESGKSSSFSGEQKATIYGLFAQWLWQPDAHTIIFGSRWDKHSRFGSVFNHRLTYNWNLGPIQPHATIGTAFRSPSLFQLFSAAPFGNPELRPEKSLGWDAGIESSWKNWRTDFTYFSNRFRDLISFGSNLKYSNVSSAETYGLESSLQRNFTNGYAKLSHTWMRAFDRQNRIELLRRPREQIALSWLQNWNLHWSTKWETTFTGNRKDVDENGSRVNMPAYSLSHFEVNWRIQNDWRWNFSIQNIFDRAYQEVRGYGTTGRTFYLGSEWRI